MPLIERIHSFHCAQHTYRKEEKRKKIEREKEREKERKKERKKEDIEREKFYLCMFLHTNLRQREKFLCTTTDL